MSGRELALLFYFDCCGQKPTEDLIAKKQTGPTKLSLILSWYNWIKNITMLSSEIDIYNNYKNGPFHI